MAVYKYPTAFRERMRFHGPGLHVYGALAPIDDLRAVNVNQVRMSVESPPYSDAAIDDIISHYMPNGIDIIWLPKVVSTGGTFTVPTTQCQQIAARWAAAGYQTPVFELTNEYVSSHHSNFANEAANIAAYITQVQAFKTAMAGYDYLVSLVNDHPDYWRKFYDALVAAGKSTLEAVLHDNVIQGLHNYYPYTNAMGTFDFCEKMLQIDAIYTEGQEQAVTASKAQCVAWLTGMYQNMGNRPWCAFASHQGLAYDAGTQGYAWYNTATPNAHGIGVLSSRTATLTEYAAAIGATLS